ncbi:hypothetical protein O3P69_016341 [Scylla paramamosain]|uniref:RNase H type-1 domain-containing protein n=1 Tax=Scylla paramamosain TaxID=85552 RepID=A0AAW0TCP9_SCYPA
MVTGPLSHTAHLPSTTKGTAGAGKALCKGFPKRLPKGLRANREELQFLIKMFQPSYLCLEETMIGLSSPPPPAGYEVIYSRHDPAQAHHVGGVSSPRAPRWRVDMADWNSFLTLSKFLTPSQRRLLPSPDVLRGPILYGRYWNVKREEGVPQGKVLSITLFGLAINDMTESLPKYIHCTLRSHCIKFCWVPAHVAVEGNERADEVAEAAALRPARGCALHFRDLFPSIRSAILDVWQTGWEEAMTTTKMGEITARAVRPWPVTVVGRQRHETD